MAVLTITVDDTQVARVRDAYGAATNAALRTAIIADIKQKVISYEVNAAHTLKQIDVQTAQAAVISAGQTAKTGAEAISIT